MSAEMRRVAFRSESDPLGTDAVRNVARKIMCVVGDARMHPSIAYRAARAAVEHRLSPEELIELCDIIEVKRSRNELNSPGAYFTASLKRLFQRHEIPWQQPRRGPSSEWKDLF
jgi:hypothetical protein